MMDQGKLELLYNHRLEVGEQMAEWFVERGETWPFYYQIPLLDESGNETGETSDIRVNHAEWKKVLSLEKYLSGE